MLRYGTLILALIAAPAMAQQITLEQLNQALSLSKAAAAQDASVKDALIAELTEKLKKAEAACKKP